MQAGRVRFTQVLANALWIFSGTAGLIELQKSSMQGAEMAFARFQRQQEGPGLRGKPDTLLLSAWPNR